MAKRTTRPVEPLAPVLEMIRRDSIGGLDDCQLEIVREQLDQFPPVPDTVPCTTPAGYVAYRLGRAS